MAQYKLLAGGGAALPGSGVDAKTLDIGFTSAGANAFAFDPLNPTHLYIACTEHHYIVKLDLLTGLTDLFLGAFDVPGTSPDGAITPGSLLTDPRVIVFDTDGTMYVGVSDRIYKIDPGKTTVTNFITSLSGGVASIALTTTKLWITGTAIGTNTELLKMYDKASPVAPVAKSSTDALAVIADPTAPDAVFYLRNIGAGSTGTEPNIYHTTSTTGEVLHYATGFSGFFSLAVDPIRNVILGYVSSGGLEEIDFLPIGSPASATIHTPVGFTGTFPTEGTSVTSFLTATSGGWNFPLAVSTSGQRVIGADDFVWTFADPPLGDPAGYLVTPDLYRSDKAGFDDTVTAGALNTYLSANSNQAATGGRPVTSIADYVAGANPVVFIGSSFSNTDAEEIETEAGLLQFVSDGSIGLFQVDFQTRGAGDGKLFGSSAPRLHVVNGNGDFLVERFESGGTVRDYAVLMFFAVAGQRVAYVCGLRDISTRAAAFVIENATDVKFSGALAATNAVLVSCTYSTTVNTNGLGSYTPTIGTISVMPLADVAGTQPIPP